MKNHRKEGARMPRILAYGMALVSVALGGFRLAYPSNFAGKGNDSLVDPIFYAAQWPLLIIALAPLAWLARHQSGQRVSFIAIAAIVTASAFWLWESVRINPPKENPTGLRPTRIISWTADDFDHTNMEEVAGGIPKLEPDLFLMLESIVDLGRQKRAFPPNFPDHDMKLRQFGMTTISKLKEKNYQFRYFDSGNGRANIIELQTKSGQPFTLIGYDQISTPNVSRAPALAELAALVATIPPPVVVTGDFNTPSDSPHFAPLKQTLRNAYHEVGSGLEATWPAFFPLLSLDQVWISEQITPISVQHERLSWVGHEGIVFDFVIKTP